MLEVQTNKRHLDHNRTEQSQLEISIPVKQHNMKLDTLCCIGREVEEQKRENTVQLIGKQLAVAVTNHIDTKQFQPTSTTHRESLIAEDTGSE